MSIQKITPENYKHGNLLNIIIGCADFTTISGAPMCIYTLGKEMISRGHSVTIVAPQTGDIMKQKAEEAGMRVFNISEIPNYKGIYDIIQLNTKASEILLKLFPKVPAFHIVRSQLDVETPIEDCPQIRKYICVREEVREHIINKHNIPKEKCVYIPTGVDFERFDEKLNDKQGIYTILSPSTIDEGRKPMLLHLINRVKTKNELLVLEGRDFGALNNIQLPSNVVIRPPRWGIESSIAQADEVVSYLEGRVVYEAWAMNKKVTIYDFNGEDITYDKRPDNYKDFDIKKIADKYLKVYQEKWADIIIPHHDRIDLLQKVLQNIPIRNYNVIIIRGSFFAEACNKGAEIAKTGILIFCNDDIELKPEVLWELVDSPFEIAGVEQYYSDGEKLCAGIGLYSLSSLNSNLGLVKKRTNSIFPSGALFKIKKKLFKSLGGMNELYKNGGEDREMFLEALDRGNTIGLIETPVIHHCSQSTGRFDYLNANELRCSKIWSPERINTLIKKLGKEYLFNSINNKDK